MWSEKKVYQYGLVLLILIIVIWLLYPNKIRLKIMQTHRYDYDDLPEAEKIATYTWKNQANEYYFKNDEDSYTFLLHNFDQYTADIYKSIKIGAFKADFFRLCWIYKEGGIYADCDTECVLTDLQEWIDTKHDVDIIFARDDPSDKGQFYQAFIYSKEPGNKFIKMCIDRIIENVEGYKNGMRFTNPFEFSGPKLIQNVMGNTEPVEPGPYKNHDTTFYILTWNNDIIMDGNIEIFRHKCQKCESHLNSDNYWIVNLDKKLWVE